MPKFYFTYGLNPQYPFRDGWTEVEADNSDTAKALFRAVHPDTPKEPGILNCAFVYTEEQFQQTEMYQNDNFGGRCRETIRVERTAMPVESEDC